MHFELKVLLALQSSLVLLSPYLYSSFEWKFHWSDAIKLPICLCLYWN